MSRGTQIELLKEEYDNSYDGNSDSQVLCAKTTRMIILTKQENNANSIYLVQVVWLYKLLLLIGNILDR